ncbi:MAG: type IV toxin-antitoxin system AbiEi family antitoxin domain-containing protein [Actinomycetota bacterium]
MTPERRAEDLAARRYGVLSRAEARGLGMTDRMIDRRVASGRWRVIHPGVYRLAGAPDTWESRLMAAQLSLGPESFVSHRSAGAIHGLDGVPVGFVEMSTPSSRGSDAIVVHRIRGPKPPARTLRGFRVTSIERTLFDLCSVLPPVRCGEAIDDALRKRLTTLGRLQEIARGYKGRSGAGTFRQLLALRDDRDGIVESKLETKLLRILKRIEAFEFTPQLEVHAESFRYRLDFAYPDQMVAVEGQSLRYHLGDGPMGYDTKRDRRLRRLGWEILLLLARRDLVRAGCRRGRCARCSRQVCPVRRQVR